MYVDMYLVLASGVKTINSIHSLSVFPPHHLAVFIYVHPSETRCFNHQGLQDSVNRSFSLRLTLRVS